jgi:hypothetical protein
MEGFMTKNRLWLLLGVVLLAFAIGSLVPRSQAQPQPQPEKGRLSDSPIFLKIGTIRINPDQVAYVTTWTGVGDPGAKYLGIHAGGGAAPMDLEFATDGRAEALLEWFDAHSVELKPKALKKQ